jgi:putative ABC transport system substrate-binding protein
MLGTISVIGLLSGTDREASRLDAIWRGLNEAGYVEGHNVAIEYRWGEGRRERFAEIAAEFVRLKVDLIVAGGSAIPLLKQATSVVPIVFVLATDPIAGGLVASLARPGGNVTGLSNQGVDLAGGRLERSNDVCS